jgi:hypothetical protein
VLGTPQSLERICILKNPAERTSASATSRGGGGNPLPGANGAEGKLPSGPSGGGGRSILKKVLAEHEGNRSNAVRARISATPAAEA